MDSNIDLKAIETLFIQSKIDYQLLYDSQWWKCDIELTGIENQQTQLQLQLGGKDQWGKWIFQGQIMISPQNTIILSAKKTYQVYSIDDYSIFYEGSFDTKQNGFFGRWYYDDSDNPDLDRKFYIKFISED